MTGKKEQLISAVLETLAGPVIVTDRALKVVAASPSAALILGAEINGGATLPKLICGSAPERPIAEALLQGIGVAGQVLRPKADGTPQTISVNAAPISGPEGEPLGFTVHLGAVPPAGQEDQSGAAFFHGFWTRDPRVKSLLSIVVKAAASEATVLLRGESGTGKELLARALHLLSPRRDGPFQAINCAALSPALLESELFGHLRGAFTGAVRDTIGHFRMADRGTLFLDEIAEIPLELQAKLLRVLETKNVLAVGSTDPIAVDVRIVAATHRSLRAEVAAGRFRADLMYRLRVVPIFIPPLRDRGDDVLLLAEKALERTNKRRARKIERISGEAADVMLGYEWPGNVRELENALEYAYVVGEGPVLQRHELPPEIAESEPVRAVNVPPPVRSDLPAEAQQILQAIERSGGSKTRAAKLLGLSRVTLWRRMRDLGLLEEAP